MTETQTSEPDVDHWPTPDASTYEKAARAMATAEGYDVLLSREAIEALVAKYAADPTLRAVVEAVWAARLPTPWAYHQACRAYERYKLRYEVLAGELDNLRMRLLEEIAQAIEADDGFEHKYERDYAARIAREHGKESPR